MKSEIKSIDLVFENCDYLVLCEEQNVRASLQVTSKNYRAELYNIGKNTYNIFDGHLVASWGIIEFNKTVLNKITEFEEPCSLYINDKTITHINIVTNDNKSYYIAVPYLPISRKYGLYNLYQKERIDKNIVTITFSKRNLWGNLPKALWWWIRWTNRNIKFRFLPGRK